MSHIDYEEVSDIIENTTEYSIGMSELGIEFIDIILVLGMLFSFTRFFRTIF